MQRLPKERLSLFAVLIRNGQFFTTMSTARSQDAATIWSGHSLAEAVFVFSLTIRRLKRSFHYLLRFNFNQKNVLFFELQRYDIFLTCAIKMQNFLNNYVYMLIYSILAIENIGRLNKMYRC